MSTFGNNIQAVYELIIFLILRKLRKVNFTSGKKRYNMSYKV